MLFLALACVFARVSPSLYPALNAIDVRRLDMLSANRAATLLPVPAMLLTPCSVFALAAFGTRGSRFLFPRIFRILFVPVVRDDYGNRYRYGAFCNKDMFFYFPPFLFLCSLFAASRASFLFLIDARFAFAIFLQASL